MSGRTWSAWIAALLLFASASTASAAALVRQSAQQLASQAQLVVRAAVVSQEESVDPAAKAHVVLTRLQVAETWKGSASGTIVVQQLGRLVRGRQTGVAGDAIFTQGEEVIVFLHAGTQTHAGRYFLLGLGQGKFHVDRTAKGAPTLTRDVRGGHYVKGSHDEMPSTLPALRQLVAPAGGAR